MYLCAGRYDYDMHWSMGNEKEAEQELTYDAAYSRLQAIAAEVNGGGLGVDAVNRLLNEADMLVARCRELLYGLEQRVARTAEAWQHDEEEKIGKGDE